MNVVDAYKAWSEESKNMAEQSLPAFNEQYNKMDESFKQCTHVNDLGVRCVLRAGHPSGFQYSSFSDSGHLYE